jgi:signal transduction histidine kinase
MARSVLVVLGLGAIGWGLLCLFAGPIMPPWMGLSGPDKGELYIESIAVNVGLWSSLGIFAILGAAFQRLRSPAILALLVCTAGIAGGRIFGMTEAADAGVYTRMALALEIAIIVAASAAYISEKSRLAQEAKELKRAEKAALEAALAAEQARLARSPSPSPGQHL